MALTPKQQQFLNFVLDFHNSNGFSPSQTEIAKHFGFSSLGTVAKYLVRLKELGLIKNIPNSRRGISVTLPIRRQDTGVSLPLLGRVAAGNPIEVFNSQDSIEVPPFFVKKGKHFVLEVQGNSMIEDGILDGDFVIVKKQFNAERGQMIVALVDDAATVKRYQPKKDFIELHPANPAYKPIRVSFNQSFQIQGVVTGVMRKVI